MNLTDNDWARLLEDLQSNVPDRVNAAIGVIWEQFYAPLVTFASKRLGDEHAAEEVVRNAILILPMKVDTRSYLKEAFLYGLVFFACNDYRKKISRKRKRTTSLEDAGGKTVEGEPHTLDLLSREPLPDEVASDRDLHLLVKKFLHEIPCEQADVIKMRFKEDLTFREIAELTGIPADTLRKRFKAGMKKIRKLVAETDPRERKP